MTRDRITQGAFLAIVIATGVWVAFHTYWIDVTVSTPLQGEAATNPYYSVERLVRALEMSTQKTATVRVLPPHNAVLFIGGLGSDVVHKHGDSLQHWVESGGRLVVTGNAIWSSPALQAWSGIAPSHGDPKSSAVCAPPKPARVSPPGLVRPKAADCAPMSEQLHGQATGEALRICAPESVFGFSSHRTPAWELSNAAGMQLLRVVIGSGSLTVIGPDFLLQPKTFLRGDDARAFINATQLKRGDRLWIFDASVAEPLLAMLWRVAAPAIVFFALAIALLILRHWPRFGPLIPMPMPARRSLAEQIRANAGLAWRTGNLGSLRRAVLRALERSADQSIVGFASLNTRRRAVELGRRAGVDSITLNSAMSEAAAGDASVQRSAIAVLEHTRRALNSSTRQTG